MSLTDKKRIHCIGIGGIGLSAIAEILLVQGHIVSGSDMKESEITDKLIRAGASIFLGHRMKNVANVDLIIYSAAVSSENPEIIQGKKLGIPIITRAEALAEIMDHYEYSVAIAGTHGKTTTTSMISLILENSKLDPTILVGGNLKEIEGNVKVGESEYFVTEACEYMDSFLNLRPKYAVILNIDSDHLDYFKDIDHIVRSFNSFANLVPEDGAVIAYDANPFVNSILMNLDKRVITFGFHERCTFRAVNIIFNIEGMPSFTVSHHNKEVCNIQLRIPGEHNIANALAAVATCYDMGAPLEDIVNTLENFQGIQRRFDIIGQTQGGVRIVDDYAHHPAEIRATLEAALNIPHEKLWCIFQPHTYTRTRALFDDFIDAFNLSDKLLMAEIYAAREKNIYKISSQALIDGIKIKHPDKKAFYFNDFYHIAKYVLDNANSNDLVITMGAGDIYKVGELILELDRGDEKKEVTRGKPIVTE